MLSESVISVIGLYKRSQGLRRVHVEGRRRKNNAEQIE